MNKDRQKINEMSELKIKITASEKVLKLRNKEAVVPFATPNLPVFTRCRYSTDTCYIYPFIHVYFSP